MFVPKTGTFELVAMVVEVSGKAAVELQKKLDHENLRGDAVVGSARPKRSRHSYYMIVRSW